LDPELTYTASEIAPFSGSLVRDAGEAAGSYRIRQGSLSAGSNYAISFTEVDFAIMKKRLSVTADDRTKVFGQTLTLGAGQTAFSTGQMVGTDKIDSVTITASGGTEANDPVGTYVLTPSAPTGQNFAIGNYDIYYTPGTLTVSDANTRTFDEWMSTNYPQLTGNDALPEADPDQDGLANLVEYYMGLSPASPNQSATAVSWQAGNPSSISMSYRRAKAVTGVTGGVSWKSSLASGDWSTSNVTENTVDMTSYDSVTATVTNAPGDMQKFLRLKVTQP
jgi:hypothetical protein